MFKEMCSEFFYSVLNIGKRKINKIYKYYFLINIGFDLCGEFIKYIYIGLFYVIF